MEIDHRYTWVLPRKAWYIRFYLWLWEASIDDINFCKLFWGYTLLWIGAPGKLLAVVGRRIEKMVDVMRDHRLDRRNVRYKTKISKAPTINVITFRAIVGRTVRLDAENKLFSIRDWYVDNGEIWEEKPYTARVRFSSPGERTVKVLLHDMGHRQDWPREGKWIECKIKVHKHPPLPLRALEGVAMGVTKTIMVTGGACSPITRPVCKAGKVLSLPFKKLFRKPSLEILRHVSIITGVAGALVIGVLCIIGLVHTFPAWGPVIATIATNSYVLVGAGAISLLVGIIVIGMVTGFWLALRTVIAKPAVEGTKHGALSFRNVMVIGYKSVKGNTCPRVEIEE